VNEDDIITSVITYAEFGIKPEKEGKQRIINEFETFLKKFDIPMISIQKEHAELAYQLRANNDFYKEWIRFNLELQYLKNAINF